MTFAMVWPGDGLNTAAYAALTSIGAVIGGLIVSDLVGSLLSRGATDQQLAR